MSDSLAGPHIEDKQALIMSGLKALLSENSNKVCYLSLVALILYVNTLILCANILSKLSLDPFQAFCSCALF